MIKLLYYVIILGVAGAFILSFRAILKGDKKVETLEDHMKKEHDEQTS